MRLRFVQVTRFRLTIVRNFSNLVPPPEIVIYAAVSSALHFNLSLLQTEHLTDYTKKRRFLIFFLQLGTNKIKRKKKKRRRRRFWARPRHFLIGPSKVSDRFV